MLEPNLMNWLTSARCWAHTENNNSNTLLYQLYLTTYIWEHGFFLFFFFFNLKSVNVKDWKSLRHKTGAVMSELCASPHGMWCEWLILNILGLLSPKKGKLENRTISISAVELQRKVFQLLHNIFGHSISFSVATPEDLLVCCSDSKPCNTFAALRDKKLHPNA